MTWDQWRMIAEAADAYLEARDLAKKARFLAEQSKLHSDAMEKARNECGERYKGLLFDYADSDVPSNTSPHDFRRNVPAPRSNEEFEQHEPCFGEVSQ